MQQVYSTGAVFRTFDEFIAWFDKLSRRQQKRVINVLTMSAGNSSMPHGGSGSMVTVVSHVLRAKHGSYFEAHATWTQAMNHKQRKAMLAINGVSVRAPRQIPNVGRRGRKC